ncbi:MAG: outer membrane beta-barrel protein [Bacteroidota bacterium]
MKYIIHFLLIGYLSISVLYAQEVIDTTQTQTQTELEDKKGEDQLPTDAARRFSLVFNRTLQTTNGTSDTIPLNGTSSGTFFIGGGIRIPLGNQLVNIRLTPGISWTGYTYNQTNLKRYPTFASDSVNLSLERQSLTHIDLPLSFYFNISRDEDGDPRFFVEVGGYASYLMAASYKIKYEDANGLRVKEKIRDIHALEGDNAEFERLRYGAFARVGFKWIALYLDYRISDVFDEFSGSVINDQTPAGFKNPVFQPLQFGLSIFL